MMTRIQYWVATVLAAACFMAMAADLALGYGNRSARADVTQRQQYVQQSVQLEGLYKEIIRALAELAARNSDSDVKAMLQRHGITFNVNAAATPAATPAAASTPRK